MPWRYLLFSIIIYNSLALFTLFCCPETAHQDTFRSFPLMLHSTWVCGVWSAGCAFVCKQQLTSLCSHPELLQHRAVCSHAVISAAQQTAAKLLFPGSCSWELFPGSTDGMWRRRLLKAHSGLVEPVGSGLGSQPLPQIPHPGVAERPGDAPVSESTGPTFRL